MLKDKQIITKTIRKKYSRNRGILFLCLIILFFQPQKSVAQVISNTGASVSVTSGAFVNSKDIENTTGTLGNNGTINLSGNFLNDIHGSTNGNGFYNITGNWTDLGLFNAGTSTVTFNGIANQTITHGSSGETFYNLTINNPGSVITQVANPGNTLAVLNNLNITAGNLSLDPTTSTLTVGRKATIVGTLLFSNITTQTTTIADTLSGSGLLDMSGGNLPHVLNLAGRINAIGTFSTSPTSSSTVNYDGTTQTVFPAANYRNLTISNSGVKTLQGNSLVGLKLFISGGTFDLGTTTTALGVQSTTTINGSLSFDGTTTKTVTLSDSLNGTGSIDMSGGNLPHLLNLYGTINSIGSYTSGNGSIVDYILNGDQTVFTSNNYSNIRITGSGIKTLNSDISASGKLIMLSGNINSNGNTLKITNSSPGAISRTAGTIIGKLQRAIGKQDSIYLYPIGSASTYNPMKITFLNLSSGPLTAQFKTGDIGTLGLPLDDAGDEIWDRFTTGYWTLTSVSPMASNDYSVNLNYNGFSGVDPSSRVIKRTNGGSLQLDGVHDSITIAPEIKRDSLSNGISTVTTDLAIGKGRPSIVIQPQSLPICEGSNAIFQVKASGRGPLTYQWQVNTGGGFINIFDGGGYSGTLTPTLTITGAGYVMNGYLYRCIITDGSLNTNTTNVVLLTVNKIPVATTAQSSQNECPGVAFADIVLGTSNNVAGTTFGWVRNTPAGITTLLPVSGSAVGNKISGTFSNTTDNPITVTFTITPTGPPSTYCVGNNIQATVTVNPIPRVLPLAATIQCDSTITNLQLQSPSIFTSGFVSFKYTVTTTGSVTGYTTPTLGLPNNYLITDKLVNHTDAWQVVTYNVVPVSPVGCADGPAQNINVTVNPTPRVIPVNLNNLKPDSSICSGGTTNILLTTPTVMTSGAIRFDYSVSATGGPGVVTGNMTPETNRIPGYNIARSYLNSSDTLQSVYYYIIPKVDNAICVPGKTFKSEIKVHARPLQNLLTVKPLTCEGGSDATLKAVTSEGASPYHIIWNGLYYPHYHNIDSVTITNLKQNTYTVIVSDNLGCSNSDTTIVEGALINSYLTAYPKSTGNDITCPGSNDGELGIKVISGGTPAYEYWITQDSQDTTSAVIHGFLNVTGVFNNYYNLYTGTYYLFLRDKNGCFDTSWPEEDMTEPDQIAVTFGKKQYSGGFNVSCKGYNDGKAWVKTISGGNGGYTYQWSTINGSISGSLITDTIRGLTVGKYYLKTTDNQGCIKMDSITISEPNGMLLSGIQLSHSPDNNYNVSCNGGDDGFININITGGSGSYLYQWTGPDGFTATTQNISLLKAGHYTATVTDITNSNCILMPKPDTTVTQPALLNIIDTTSFAPDGLNNIPCSGGTGWINLTVTGGSIGNYKYTWTTSDGSGLIAGQKNQMSLTAGTYHVVVIDSNMCVATKDIILTQPQPLSTVLVPTHITCYPAGFNNGSIDLTVTGGIGPYLYNWSNGAISEDINGLTQGYYKVTVKDINGCTKTDSVRINLPPVLTLTDSISFYNGYNIQCFGANNGIIKVIPVTGRSPYIYNWTGPDGFISANQKITGLNSGQYNLQITDANLCTTTDTFNLTEPGKLGMTIALSTSSYGDFNINCAGAATGSINVDAVNNVGATSWYWSDGSTEESRTNIRAGTYKVTVTDMNSCSAKDTVTLTEPDSIKTSFTVKQAFCPDSPDGQIHLTVTGGVIISDYTFKWSDNSTTQDLTNILRGFYRVTVTDANNCSVKDSVKMAPLNRTCLIIPNAISPNGDNINDVWNIGNIDLYPQIEIKIFNRWGELLWQSEKGYPHPWNGRSNGVLLPIDSYHYIIDLHNGSRPIIGTITIVR